MSKGMMLIEAFRAERLRQRQALREKSGNSVPAADGPGFELAELGPGNPERSPDPALPQAGATSAPGQTEITASTEPALGPGSPQPTGHPPLPPRVGVVALQRSRVDAASGQHVQAGATGAADLVPQPLRLTAASAQTTGASAAVMAPAWEPPPAATRQPKQPAYDPPLAEIGVGPGMLMRLGQLGVHTTRDLAATEPAALRAALGEISRLLDVESWIATARQRLRLSSAA